MRKTAVDYLMTMVGRLYKHKLVASEVYTENLCVALGLRDSKDNAKYVKYARRPKVVYSANSALAGSQIKQAQ